MLAFELDRQRLLNFMFGNFPRDLDPAACLKTEESAFWTQQFWWWWFDPTKNLALLDFSDVEAASAEHSREQNGGPPVTTCSSGCVSPSMAVQGALLGTVKHIYGAVSGCHQVQLWSALACAISDCHRLAWETESFRVYMALTASLYRQRTGTKDLFSSPTCHSPIPTDLAWELEKHFSVLPKQCSSGDS